MTIEAAEKAFAQMCDAAFPERGSSPVERSRILEQISKGILKELHLPEDTLFCGDLRSGSGCKVYVTHTFVDIHLTTPPFPAQFATCPLSTWASVACFAVSTPVTHHTTRPL